MSERPLVDPLSDSLADLSDEQRAEAMRRLNLLRPHFEDGVSLFETARAADTSLRTAQRWAALYLSGGLAGLVRSRRCDARLRKMPSALVELIEGLALQKPRLSAATINRRVTPIAESRHWQAPFREAQHRAIAGTARRPHAWQALAPRHDCRSANLTRQSRPLRSASTTREFIARSANLPMMHGEVMAGFRECRKALKHWIPSW